MYQKYPMISNKNIRYISISNIYQVNPDKNCTYHANITNHFQSQILLCKLSFIQMPQALVSVTVHSDNVGK